MRCHTLAMEQTKSPEAEAKPITTIAEYNEHDKQLAALREQFSRPYDVTKPAELTEARKARAAIKSVRTALEAKRKEIKAEVLARGRAIDTEAARIEAELLKIEEPIDAAIKGEEQRREQAKAAIEAARVARAEKARAVASLLRAIPANFIGASAAEIATQIAATKAGVITVEQEQGETHVEDVEAARAEVLHQLAKMYDATILQEEARAKLDEEKKRNEAERARLDAERAEAEAAKRAEEERAAADRKRIADEQQAARERIAAEERAAEKRRADADAKAAAERERLAKEQQAKLDAERAKVDAEKRAAEEKQRKEREAAEAKERHEREVAETKKRDAERAELRRMDGYALLSAFVERHGSEPEFEAIAKTIASFIADNSKPSGKTAVAKKTVRA